MKKTLFIIYLLGLFQLSLAQPNTEVYLFDLKKKGKTFVVSNPRNISANQGYDNQPSFLPNGSAILFTSTQPDGQTDIIKYTIASKQKTKLTSTTGGSEYSPTVMPNNTHFSAILLEKDGRQLLWKYPLTGGKGEIAVPDLKIGYHCWYDQNTLFSFVLGDQFTLQKSSLSTGKNEIMASDIGRSLHRIPKQEAISYIQKHKDKPWVIQSLNPISGETSSIIETLEKSEDMAWTPKGIILMGKGDELFKFDPKRDTTWVKIASLSNYGLKGITRLAISPKGNKVVLVVEGQ